jgi:hypothetical protein
LVIKFKNTNEAKGNAPDKTIRDSFLAHFHYRKGEKNYVSISS